MSWVPAVSEEQAGPEVRPVYKFLQENWGFVPNYFLALGTGAQVEPKVMELFRFAYRLTRHPANMEKSDVERLPRGGLE